VGYFHRRFIFPLAGYFHWCFLFPLAGDLALFPLADGWANRRVNHGAAWRIAAPFLFHFVTIRDGLLLAFLVTFCDKARVIAQWCAKREEVKDA
jgi:hypothetical protein